MYDDMYDDLYDDNYDDGSNDDGYHDDHGIQWMAKMYDAVDTKHFISTTSSADDNVTTSTTSSGSVLDDTVDTKHNLFRQEGAGTIGFKLANGFKSLPSAFLSPSGFNL